MEYAQLNEDGSYGHQITTHGNVKWDGTHFCPASALTPDEAEYFRVVPLLATEPPTINPTTQSVIRDGGEQANGQWQYRWAVEDLTAEQIAVNQASAEKMTRDSIIGAVQCRLDSWAQSHGYDSIISLCTYASSSIQKFKAEGQNGVDKRDATWARLIEIMVEGESGSRPIPAGYADIEADLPELGWPL